MYWNICTQWKKKPEWLSVSWQYEKRSIAVWKDVKSQSTKSNSNSLNDLISSSEFVIQWIVRVYPRFVSCCNLCYYCFCLFITWMDEKVKTLSAYLRAPISGIPCSNSRSYLTRAHPQNPLYMRLIWPKFFVVSGKIHSRCLKSRGLIFCPWAALSWRRSSRDFTVSNSKCGANC